MGRLCGSMLGNLFCGVVVIKVAIDGAITLAEMTAIVEEAHRQLLRVAVHVRKRGRSTRVR